MEQESPFGRTSNEMLDEDHFFDMDSDMDDAFKVCAIKTPSLIFLTALVCVYLCIIYKYIEYKCETYNPHGLFYYLYPQVFGQMRDEEEEDSHLDADIESADELEEEEDLDLDDDDDSETATQASSPMASTVKGSKKSPIRRRLKVCVHLS